MQQASSPYGGGSDGGLGGLTHVSRHDIDLALADPAQRWQRVDEDPDYLLVGEKRVSQGT